METKPGQSADDQAKVPPIRPPTVNLDTDTCDLRRALTHQVHGFVQCIGALSDWKTETETETEREEILPQFRIPRDGPLSKGRVGRNMSMVTLKFLLFGVEENQTASDKFHLVEHFVTEFLVSMKEKQDARKIERNKMVLSVLEVVSALIK